MSRDPSFGKYSTVTKAYMADPRFNPDHVYQVFLPYNKLIDQIQAVLLWRLPIPLIIALLIINIFFFFAHYLEIGALSVFLFFVFLYHTILFISEKFGTTIASFLFPNFNPEEYRNESVSNHIYPLRDITDYFSFLIFKLVTFYEKIFYTKTSLFDALIYSGVAFILFLIFYLIDSFWIIFCLTNLIILLPGFIFHPVINPYIKPYLVKLNNFIGSPHYKAE